MAFDDEQKKCGGITFGGLLVVVLSIAMVAVGVVNLDLESDEPIKDGTCKAQVHIPIFLIGAGIIFVVMLFGRFFFAVRLRFYIDANPMKTTNGISDR